MGLKLAGRLIDYEALSRLRGQIVLKSLEFGYKSNQGGILPITAFNFEVHGNVFFDRQDSKLARIIGTGTTHELKCAFQKIII